MKFTGKVSRIGKDNKIQIPLKVLKKVGISTGSDVVLRESGNSVIIQKHFLKCLVTGTTENVTELFPGIYLSPKGMKLLEEEIKKNIDFL